MENKTNKRSLFSDRKFKYGSLAVTLTVAFVALIIIFNAVVYALAYSYGWYLDLTGQQYYGITDNSSKYLDDVLTEDVEVKIIFCQDKDRVLGDSAGYYVYKCAETYKKTYPKNISIEFLDVISHPDLADIYVSQLGTPLLTNNVIIESNQSEGFRLLNYENFYTFDADTGEVYAFNGERRFTSYIISLCSDYPICYFTVGHGESVYDDVEDEAPNSIYNLMIDAGFDVRTIDLSKEDFDGNAKVVIINDPIYDFAGADQDVNEIEKLGRFMSDTGGNAMVFLSPENQGNLKVLKQWLADWGIGITDGQIKDEANSLSVDGLTLVSVYTTEGFASSPTLALRGHDSAPSTIVKNAVALKPLFEAQNSKEPGVMLNSSPSSKLCTTNGDLVGSYPIAMITRQTKYDSMTDLEVKNYLLVTSAGYVEQAYIDTNAYGNRDTINYLVEQMGKKIVPLDIDFKVFASEALDITTFEAYTWTVVLVGIIPLTVCGLGIFVCYRRKRL